VIFSLAFLCRIFICVRGPEKEVFALYNVRARRTSNAPFFKKTQLLCSIFVIAFCSCLLVNQFLNSSPIKREHFEILNAIVLTLMSFTLLFYGQIFFPMRHLVFSVFMMIYDLLNFVFLWLMLSAPFGLCFLFVLSRPHLGLCHANYDGLFNSLYTNFKIILNMEPVDNFGLSNTYGLAVTHVLFVGVNVLLLLNLLIAVFSDSIAFVNNHAEILQTVQKLSFSLAFSQTFASIAWSKFTKSKSKNLIYEKEKVFLHVRLLAPKPRSQKLKSNSSNLNET
jgi:hypothetical protein